MRIGSYSLKLEKKVSLSTSEATIISVFAIIVGLILFSLIFFLAGVNPLVAYKETFSYAFANQFGLPLTINRFIFLLLCTCAFIIPYRAGLWNIGMAGQLYIGALAAYFVPYALGVNEFQTLTLAPFLVITLMLIASAVGGAALAGIAGYLKGKYNINEIVVTMMLNFMSFWVVSFMIKEGGPYMNPGGRGESFELPQSLHPALIRNVPFTIIIALAAAYLLYIIFKRTRIGYEIKAYGQNPTAADYAGISTLFTPIIVFIMGGALAGMSGYHYFAAVPGVYKIARNYGYFGDLAFYGIICGLISQGNALASIPVALLFGGLSIGARFVQGKLGMNFGVDYALLGVLMITLVIFQFFYRNSITWEKMDKENVDA